MANEKKSGSRPITVGEGLLAAGAVAGVGYALSRAWRTRGTLGEALELIVASKIAERQGVSVTDPGFLEKYAPKNHAAQQKRLAVAAKATAPAAVAHRDARRVAAYVSQHAASQAALKDDLTRAMAGERWAVEEQKSAQRRIARMKAPKGLGDLTVAQLKSAARDASIKGTSKMAKAQLLATLDSGLTAKQKALAVERGVASHNARVSVLQTEARISSEVAEGAAARAQSALRQSAEGRIAARASAPAATRGIRAPGKLGAALAIGGAALSMASMFGGRAHASEGAAQRAEAQPRRSAGRGAARKASGRGGRMSHRTVDGRTVQGTKAEISAWKRRRR